ncbi:MAG: T9SS type A sorting domain-containing protein [Ignavibacteriales bacterium]|nr:T9SS type A sorting domain-containing protein [Ignavibacteriales bacterium]
MRGKEHFFYLVQYYPNQYSDTLTINISAHDSIIVSFFNVDLCPICVNSVETFFQDTLQFEFSFHELYNYTFSKLIGISGQGHLSAVGVEEELPYNFELLQNYPNPFNPSTKIKYTIPTVTLSLSKGDTYVTLKVYDVLGNEVAVLVDEFRQAGIYEVTFDASQLSSGIYFYTLKVYPVSEAGIFIETKKLVLMK